MKIEKHEVEHVARLARLKTTPEQIDTLTDQLNSILGYMEKLNELDASGLEPMAHPLALDTPLRPDEVRPSLEVESALSNAPGREGSFFKVPKVI